jgi:transposase
MLLAIRASWPSQEPEVISMTMFLTVRALHEERVPKKTIARRLGIDVRTVRKHIRRIGRGASEPRRAVVPKKLDGVLDTIEAKVGQGLSAIQIFQDLSADPLFGACYETVKRAVSKLRRVEPEVYCRMSFAPGEEAQLDFGDIGVLDVGGQRRRVWLFAMTLCFSRHSYYELVLDQTVPTFLGAIRRAFEHFGGVPTRIKPDNLRSAVLISALGERHYQEDFFRFCQHYGCVPDAARPATPTDKGRTERDIGYVKGGCFRGRSFASFDEAALWLARWSREVAAVRVHGTTRRRPIDLFDETERAALRPLPSEPYEIAVFTHNKVRRDCHVQVLGNYYSVPHTLVGETVSVRRTEQRIDVFAAGNSVASHARAVGEGKDVTDVAHYPPTKRLGSQEIHRRRVELVRSAGPHAQSYLGRLREGPWVFGDSVARLARLAGQYGLPALEKACARAQHFGALDGAARIERILVKGLHELALDPPRAVSDTSARDFGRELREYDLALLCCKEAS